MSKRVMDYLGHVIYQDDNGLKYDGTDEHFAELNDVKKAIEELNDHPLADYYSCERKAKEKCDISDDLAEYIKRKAPEFWVDFVDNTDNATFLGVLTVYKALYVVENRLVNSNELTDIVNKAIAK